MTEIRLIDVEEQPTVGLRREVRTEALADFLTTAFTTVMEALSDAGGQPDGAPFALFRGTPSDVVDVEAGFPVAAPITLPGEFASGTLPAARAVEAVHMGSYETLPQTYAEIEGYIAEHDLRPLGDMWERYESGPDSDPDPANWRTRVLWPVSGPQVARS